MYAEAAVPSSPLEQFEQGIPIHKIQCTDDLNLILRPHTEIPVCVEYETRDKLVERSGFVINLEVIDKIVSSKNDALLDSSSSSANPINSVTTISNAPSIGETAELTLTTTITPRYHPDT